MLVLTWIGLNLIILTYNLTEIVMWNKKHDKFIELYRICNLKSKTKICIVLLRKRGKINENSIKLSYAGSIGLNLILKTWNFIEIPIWNNFIPLSKEKTNVYFKSMSVPYSGQRNFYLMKSKSPKRSL